MNEIPEPTDPHAPSGVTIAVGFSIGMALHLIQIALACVAATFSSVVFGSADTAFNNRFSEIAVIVGLGLSPLAIGVNQLLYVVPAIIITWRLGRTGIMLGLVIAAAVTFLLNAACWGAFVVLIRS